jgi:hypothetical protein
MTLLAICEWIRDTNASVSIRESILLFPVLEGSHLLAIGMSAGLIAISDLRMMGVAFRKEAISDVFNGIAPFMIAGFTFTMITGLLLFWSEPVKVFESIWFRYKMLFLLLAGLNALVYHSTVWRSRAVWDKDERPPIGVRLAGLFSILTWSVVIIAGRTTAYNF